jgi:hypothetical protein
MEESHLPKSKPHSTVRPKLAKRTLLRIKYCMILYLPPSTYAQYSTVLVHYVCFVPAVRFLLLVGVRTVLYYPPPDRILPPWALKNVQDRVQRLRCYSTTTDIGTSTHSTKNCIRDVTRKTVVVDEISNK